ncbi:MAG: RNA-binding protein [Propionibacteriaceae bacterium]|nr:RNA-binding protein [Propionibacteriaceae bacterium]
MATGYQAQGEAATPVFGEETPGLHLPFGRESGWIHGEEVVFAHDVRWFTRYFIGDSRLFDGVRRYSVKKLFVGSLSWSTDDEGLHEFFAQFGTVATATVVRDRDSGRSRGFGFVEYDNDEEAARAIQEGEGAELDGRAITVNEARPREASRDGGGRRSFGGGGRDFGGSSRPSSGRRY